MRSTTFDSLFVTRSKADKKPESKAPIVATPRHEAPANSALWTKIYTRLIEARQAQANAIVARHVAQHTDQALKSYGWTDAEITDLRRRHSCAAR